MPDMKTKVAAAIKFSDLPDDVKKSVTADDADQWFYASVEAPDGDREGDIVRIKGIDTDKYTANGGPIKFISGHKQSPAPDGRLPVVGKVTKWVRTKHKTLNVPALVAGVKFAPTPLGQEFKALYAENYLTDVSIGFEPLKSTPIPNKGLDFSESAIGELSACITGMNQYAAIVRALDAETKVEEKPAIDAAELLKQITEAMAKFIADLSTKLNSRLDDLEDSIEAAAQKDATQRVPQNSAAKSDKIDLDTLRALLSGK